MKIDRTDRNINALIAAGNTRLQQESKGESYSLPPLEVAWRGSEEEFLNKQYNTFGDSLDAYNLELLRRAHRLINHMECNVGDSEDWPIIILDADQQHHTLVADLKAMVGCLTEV